MIIERNMILRWTVGGEDEI